MSALTHVRRYGAAAWRHRWKALALAWVVCLAGWAGAYTLPNQFQSSARIYADADAVLGTLLRGIAIDSSPAAQVELLQRTLLSRPNLEKVVARTELDLRIDGGQAREKLLADLARTIRITPQTRNLFTVEYRDSDPRIARNVVQTTLALFIEQATGSDRQQMDNARTFLAQQITQYEVKLREAERRRAEFQTKFVDLLPDSGGSSRLEGQRAKLAQLTGELEDARKRRELTRQQLDAAPQQLTSSEAALFAGGEGGESRLAAAERQLRELRLRFTEQHPDVVAARAAVADARSAPGGRGPASPATRNVSRANPLYEQLRVRMVDADSAVASLERQTRDAQAELERLDGIARSEPEVQAQFTNLDRDYTVLRKNYEELLARRESLQLADAARTGSDRVKLEVVDPPTIPLAPIGPNRPLLAAAALLAGIGAGLGLALLLVQLDGTFYTLHDLRRLGLPVLGSLSAARRPAGARYRSVAAYGMACGLLLITFGAVLAGPGPVREAYWTLRKVMA